MLIFFSRNKKKYVNCSKYLYICISLKHGKLMDELLLMLDGIQNKVKRLRLSNKGMQDRIQSLELERQRLMDEIASHKQQIRHTEKHIAELQATKVLQGSDNMQAKQKVKELLREIEKCYELINSQAK